MTEAEVFDNLQKISVKYLKQAGLEEHGEPPGPIYHYTGVSGMRGIIESKTIYASNAEFLNDASEVQYGRQLALEETSRIHEHCEKVYADYLKLKNSEESAAAVDAPDVTSQDIAILQELLFNAMNVLQFDPGFNCYVASFCLVDNLLSQWRAYGNNGGGFSLGFQVSGSIYKVSDQKEFWCFPIIYDPDRQRQILKKFIGAVFSSLMNCLELIKTYPNWQAGNPITARYRQTLMQGLTLIALCYKDKGFEVEQEWRICTTGARLDCEHVEFRNAKGLLVPYVPIPLEDKFIELQSITCGPGPESHLSARSVTMYLWKQGYRHIVAKRSEIPIRP